MSDRARVAFMSDDEWSASILYSALTQSSQIILLERIPHPSQLVTSIQSSQTEFVILGLRHISLSTIWEIEQMHTNISGIHSLVCLAEPDVADLWGLLAAGVTGYLHINDISDRLIDAIVNVQCGGMWWSPTLVPLLQTWSGTHTGVHRLLPSPHEIAIVTRVAQGQTNRQIANELGVSARAIHFHLGRIYRRWGVQNRTQAALFAQAQGWIDGGIPELWQEV